MMHSTTVHRISNKNGKIQLEIIEKSRKIPLILTRLKMLKLRYIAIKNIQIEL